MLNLKNMKKLISQTSNFVANQLHIIIAIIAFIIICFLTQTAKAQVCTFSNKVAKKIIIGVASQFTIFNEGFYKNYVF